MFGYAVDETPELMPAPILYAHKILKRLAEARHAGDAPQLEPDAKSQVTVEYRDGKPVRAHTDRAVDPAPRRRHDRRTTCAPMVEPYIRDTLPDGFIDRETVWHVNPTGAS